jgi:hypothetical protein
LVYNKQTSDHPIFKDSYMQKRRRLGSFGLIVMVLMTVCLVLPVLAQVQPEEEAKSGPILRIVIKDLTVQGGQPPDAVRQALQEVLPAVVDCVQAEYERAGKAPHRIMLRFNLGSNGKVVWSKLIDPPLKTLEACLNKVMPQIKLPPAGTTLSKVTVMLEAKLDHLLVPEAG